MHNQRPRWKMSKAHDTHKLLNVIPSFSYNIKKAAASTRTLKELVAWLEPAAPVYATEVDDVVLVTIPVLEAVVDFVVFPLFREEDVPMMVTPVVVTLDALVEKLVVIAEPLVVNVEFFVVVELPIVVLEPFVVDVTLVLVVERLVLVLEPLVVDVTLNVVVEEPVVVLELLEVELEEVIASVQLFVAKAATPSANAASKGAANVAARD